jgi:parvulin-like peptidyl-prolyl isomerase
VPTSEIMLEAGPGASDEDRAELRKKLDAARARVTAGESFASVARSVSEGATATAGGALGCVGAGNDEIVKAASALKPGEVSGIVESPHGMHLLRTEPKLDGPRIEEFGRHFVARKAYLATAGDAQVKAFGEQVIKRAEAGAKLEDAVEAQLATLVPAPAKKAGEEKAPALPAALTAEDRPKVEISAPFTTSGNPAPQVTPHEPLAARAFELKTPDELWKTPIVTSEGALVIQLKEKNPASRADFDKNKAQLLGPLTEAKASDALARYVVDLRKQAGDKLKVDERFGAEPKVKDDE